MGTDKRIRKYLRMRKYTHFLYFWKDCIYRRMLVLLFAKESGLKYGFHFVQFERTMGKLKTEAFGDDFKESLSIIYSESFYPIVKRIVTKMKGFAVTMGDYETTLRCKDPYMFWTQDMVWKVLRELLFAHVHHMDVLSLADDEYGFYGSILWLSLYVEDDRWQELEDFRKQSHNVEKFEAKIMIACMCQTTKQAQAYMLANKERFDYALKLLSQFDYGVFRLYFCTAEWFDETAYLDNLRYWSALNLSDQGMWELFQHLQAAFFDESGYLDQQQENSWMAAYAALFKAGAADIEDVRSLLKQLARHGTKAQHRGMMRYLKDPAMSFLRKETCLYAQQCEDLDFIAFLFNTWDLKDWSKDRQISDPRKNMPVLLETFLNWLDHIPKEGYLYDSGDFLGEFYYLKHEDVVNGALVLAKECDVEIPDLMKRLLVYMDEMDASLLAESVGVFFNLTDRETLKKSLLKLSISENEELAKAAMKALRSMLSALRLYHNPLFHKWKYFAYLNYMDPIDETDLAWLHTQVGYDHPIFDFLKNHPKVVLKKPKKEHVKSSVQTLDQTFGERMALQDHFKAKQLTRFYKINTLGSYSPFRTFSSDLLAHFVRSYEAQGSAACEQLTFNQTAYIHFRLFAMPDMSIFSKFMFAKMDLLFHVKQFRDQGKASLSHVGTDAMYRDLMQHMMTFDTKEYKQFYLNMLEHVDLVMDKTYLTTYYRVKPYQMRMNAVLMRILFSTGS